MIEKKRKKRTVPVDHPFLPESEMRAISRHYSRAFQTFSYYIHRYKWAKAAISCRRDRAYRVSLRYEWRSAGNLGRFPFSFSTLSYLLSYFFSLPSIHSFSQDVTAGREYLSLMLVDFRWGKKIDEFNEKDPMTIFRLPSLLLDISLYSFQFLFRREWFL